MATRAIERFDSTSPTEIMLGCMGSECVEREMLLAPFKRQIGFRYEHMLIACHVAERAIAMCHIDGVRRGKCERHLTAMTLPFMLHSFSHNAP